MKMCLIYVINCHLYLLLLQLILAVFIYIIHNIIILDNNYSDLGVSKLSCVLKESKNIKSINISGNNISNEFYFNRSVDFNEICFNISFSNLTEIKMNSIIIIVFYIFRFTFRR